MIQVNQNCKGALSLAYMNKEIKRKWNEDEENVWNKEKNCYEWINKDRKKD